MRFFPMIWSGGWSRSHRTILTALSIVVAFALYGLLQGFIAGIRGTEHKGGADRLFVISRVSPFDALPYSYVDIIRQIPGVVAVTPGLLLPLKNGSDERTLVCIAIEPAAFASVYHEWSFTPGAIKRLRETRDGVIVGRKLANRSGWKIGDRLPLHSTSMHRTDGSLAWPLTVVGMYDVSDDPDRAELMFLNYSYVDTARSSSQGTAGGFSLRVSDHNLVTEVAAAIDNRFRNSSDETRTSTEDELARQQADQLGDLDFVVRAVTLCTFFALLLSVGSVMSQSIHERRRDFATLKAIGFTDKALFALLVSEAMLLTMASAAVGLGCSAVILLAASDLVPWSPPPVEAVVIAMGGAALLALVTVVIPALSAARLRIVDALSRTAT